MISRRLVEKTINFDKPERVPRHLWLLPWAEEKFPNELKIIQQKYPDDIVSAPAEYVKPLNTKGSRHKKGEFIDEWGCKFENIHDGVIGITKEPLIKEWGELINFQTPESTLYLDFDTINSFCKSTNKFVIAGNIPRPLERLQFIRTMEQALMDLLLQPPELMKLLNMLHNHYCKEIEQWAKTDVDALMLMDDWGSQEDLLVSPEIFRDLFKPMYKEYCEIARHYKKYIFMHSDGQISKIFPDLIEVGVNAINSQLFCMDIKELGNKFSGKITFWGEIDRQNLLPNGSPVEIKNAVYEVHNNLYKKGGVIAQCEFGPGAKPENISKVFETWGNIL